MAYFKKRRDGYSVRWYDLDGTERRRQVPSVPVARDLIRQIERAHGAGHRWQPDATGSSPSLVGDDGLVQLYLNDRLRVWRPSTHKVRSVSLGIFRRWLEARFKRHRIGPEVLSEDLLAAYWLYLQQERGIAIGTANDRVRDVVKAWKWWRKSRERRPWIPEVEEIDLPEVPRRVARAAPTWAQMDAAVLASDGWLRKLFLVLRCTGLRKGQAMQLRWDDINMEAGILRIRPELGKTKQERSGRSVPLAPCLIEDMSGWGMREGWLIDGPATREPHRKSTKDAWERSGAPREVWRQPCHSFRHGFISEMARAEVPEFIIKRLVGHAGSVTEDVYMDPWSLIERMRSAVAAIPPVRVPDAAQVKSGFAVIGSR